MRLHSIRSEVNNGLRYNSLCNSFSNSIDCESNVLIDIILYFSRGRNISCQYPPHRSGREVFPHPAPRLYSLSQSAKLKVLPPDPLLSYWLIFHHRILQLDHAYKTLQPIPSKTLPLASPVQPFVQCLYNTTVRYI